MYLPVNVTPSRRMVVSDPSKLTYFAQANMARFGVQRAAGSLQGLGASEYENYAAMADEALKKTSTPPPSSSWQDIASGIAASAGAFAREAFRQNPFAPGMSLEDPNYRPPLPRQPAADTGLSTAAIVVGGVAIVGVLWFALKK